MIKREDACCACMYMHMQCALGDTKKRSRTGLSAVGMHNMYCIAVKTSQKADLFVVVRIMAPAPKAGWDCGPSTSLQACTCIHTTHNRQTYHRASIRGLASMLSRDTTRAHHWWWQLWWDCNHVYGCLNTVYGSSAQHYMQDRPSSCCLSTSMSYYLGHDLFDGMHLTRVCVGVPVAFFMCAQRKYA